MLFDDDGTPRRGNTSPLRDYIRDDTSSGARHVSSHFSPLITVVITTGCYLFHRFVSLTNLLFVLTFALSLSLVR